MSDFFTFIYIILCFVIKKIRETSKYPVTKIPNYSAERAIDLAGKVGGKAMRLNEVENFHPEEGMVLANATSVGMKPNIDETPIPKVFPQA